MKVKSFDFEVHGRKGQCNIVPETLSHLGEEEDCILSITTDLSWSIPDDWDTLKQGFLTFLLC